jgi:hypothetical protein
LPPDARLTHKWREAHHPAADPAFAHDPDARLGRFCDCSPYADARCLLYPVGRELGPDRRQPPG